MNAQIKTILLTILTLSVFVIALVELSGVSSTALFNKFHIGAGGAQAGLTDDEALQRQTRAAALPKTSLSFTETRHDFGKIREGAVVSHAFHFKNTGSNPLFIIKAVASCGCTVPSFPKEPIPPGGEGDIMVRFDSHNRPGHQQKNVVVYSNTQPESIPVGFDAEVE